MGKVMAALKERYAGQMDFGKASGVVKKLLSGVRDPRQRSARAPRPVQ